MNNSQRSRLKKIIPELEELKERIEAIMEGDLNAVHEEESEKVDNIPDSLADSDKSLALEESYENIDNAFDKLGCARDELEGCIEYIIEAMEKRS